MNIINNCKKLCESIGYSEWLDNFIEDVFNKSNINENELIISDIEPSKRIFLENPQGKEYTIRTWNFIVTKEDDNKLPCSEDVEWDLYFYENKTDTSGKNIKYGISNIEWENKIGKYEKTN